MFSCLLFSLQVAFALLLQPPSYFGYMRFEILAALANAVVLLGVTAYILYEAYRRFFEPTEILGWPMMLCLKMPKPSRQRWQLCL